MKDEIKEILNKMENYSGECHSILAYSLCGYKKKIHNDFRMCMNDVDKLLDYITNLQEQLHKASLDIQELTERDIWCPSNCDKLTNLQEKIKQYEDPEDLTLFYMWLDDKVKNRLTNLQEENKKSEEAVKYWQNQYDLRQKIIDEAIEYLEYQISQLDFEKDTKAKMLGSMVLVLLQGSDE